jgi:hypothetical protein
MPAAYISWPHFSNVIIHLSGFFFSPCRKENPPAYFLKKKYHKTFFVACLVLLEDFLWLVVTKLYYQEPDPVDKNFFLPWINGFSLS